MSVKSRDGTRRFFSRPLANGPPRPSLRNIPRWFWLAAGLWLAWVLVLSDHSFWRIARLKHEISMAEKDARKLKDDTEKLEALVRDPETRRFRAEEIARTQHGWAAPGEIVYRFRGDGKPDSTP